ncbi:MAG: UDP-N-acetylmuramate--L-alanine ligase [Candidatus Levybacteria bacterium RIFCSPLOWO2_12_FULL_40_10]|nr:MAG: UDP-N-acetylmuramate--L-alanine ligase [Candidatus Levybacteria bacterium RIFCSPLOWO2_12_FULL_40_10]
MYKKIYFMGIKGVGMATLAIIAKEAGFIVEGSDVEEEFITDKILKEAGIDSLIGFKKENVENFFGTTRPDECLFIATAAHDGFENPEAVFARENDYRVISHGEAVGLFMSGELFGRNDIEGISISGSHGKTTIAGMTAACLSRLGSDPSFTVGTSEIFQIGAAGHYGRGKYFIAEADEYLSELKFDRNPKFLHQHPKYLIINNIDFDHPDFFKDIEEVREAYRKFVSNLDSDSTLIVNGDDGNIKSITSTTGIKGITGDGSRIRVFTYGADEGNEFVIKNFTQRHYGAGFNQEVFGSHFEVFRKDTSLGIFELSIPGYHNAKNSLAVIALLIELGFSIQDIQRVLPEFRGIKRRIEGIGETPDGVLIFDDYAHHPEEIRKTLEAIKATFPNKKITVIFQAHTYNRTKALLSEFTSSFAGVSELIILPTFTSARDLSEHGLAEDREFVEKVRTVQPNVKLIETQTSVVEYIRKNVKGSDKIVITMGAGDVYHVAEKLV